MGAIVQKSRHGGPHNSKLFFLLDDFGRSSERFCDYLLLRESSVWSKVGDFGSVFKVRFESLGCIFIH